MMQGLESEKGAEWNMKMVVWNCLSEEQQKTLMLKAIDLKIKKKELKVAMMRDKIRLMEEKIDLLRDVKDMLKGGR